MHMSSKNLNGKIASDASVDSHLVVGYASDVEGNLDYWNRCLNISSVLLRDAYDGTIYLRGDNSHFVYGGDTVDRGPGDLRVLRDLVQLKERYPERVHLLMGNRDMNKLRLAVALNEEVLTMKPWVYWANPAIASIDNDTAYYFNDAACKMKWMLTHSMGSPFAFEYRREELIKLQLPNSDDDVTASFLNLVTHSPAVYADTKGDSSGSNNSSNRTSNSIDIGEDEVSLKATCTTADGVGLMLRFLELAQIAVIIGDAIYVHGAITEDNLGWVPDRTAARSFEEHLSLSELSDATSSASIAATAATSNAATKVNRGASSSVDTPGHMYEDPVQWCAAINAFAAAEVADYKANIGEYLSKLSRSIRELQEDVFSFSSLDHSMSAELTRRLEAIAPDSDTSAAAGIAVSTSRGSTDDVELLHQATTATEGGYFCDDDDVHVISCDTPPRTWNNSSGTSTPARRDNNSTSNSYGGDSNLIRASFGNAKEGIASSGSTAATTTASTTAAVNENESRTMSLATCSADGEADADIRKKLLWEEVGGYCHPQPGSRLLQYGMGTLANKASTKSVVYANYSGPVSEQVSHWLHSRGICKVITGHRPHGDAPFIVDSHGIQTFTMDTSYSLNVKWPESQLIALNRHEPSSAGMNSPMGMSEALGDLNEINPAEKKTLKSLYKNTPHYNSFTDTGERNRDNDSSNSSGQSSNNSSINNGTCSATSPQLVDGIGALNLDLDDICPVIEGADHIDLDDDDDHSSSASPARHSQSQQQQQQQQQHRSSLSKLLPPRHTGSNTNLLAGNSPLPRAPPVTPMKPNLPTSNSSSRGVGVAAVPKLNLEQHGSTLPPATTTVAIATAPTTTGQQHEESINWMTFSDFEQKFGTARFVEPLAALTTLTFTPRGTVAEAAIPSSAETRGLYCHSEVILAFPRQSAVHSSSSAATATTVAALAEAQSASTTVTATAVSPSKLSQGAVLADRVDPQSNGFAAISRVFLHGKTAQRSTYHFELPASENNRFIGKQTPAGWYVKVQDVKAPSKPRALKNAGNSWDSMDSISAVDTTAATSVVPTTTAATETQVAEQSYYLLCLNKGFDFQNRLVRAECIEGEFNTDAKLDAAALSVA